MPLKLLNHIIVDAQVVDSIVVAYDRCIVIIDHSLITVRSLIVAEVLEEYRYPAIELDIGTLYNIEAAVAVKATQVAFKIRKHGSLAASKARMRSFALQIS